MPGLGRELNGFLHKNHQDGCARSWSPTLWILVAWGSSSLPSGRFVYMNSSVSCSPINCPDPTWSSLLFCPLAPSTSSPSQRSSFLWLSSFVQLRPSQRRRRSQIRLVHISLSTRSDVPTIGRNRLNRVNCAYSVTVTDALTCTPCSLSRSLPPRSATGRDPQFC